VLSAAGFLGDDNKEFKEIAIKETELKMALFNTL
jgi:hypothetical protein